MPHFSMQLSYTLPMHMGLDDKDVVILSRIGASIWSTPCKHILNYMICDIGGGDSDNKRGVSFMHICSLKF